jgi:hypothetical protein
VYTEGVHIIVNPPTELAQPGDWPEVKRLQGRSLDFQKSTKIVLPIKDVSRNHIFTRQFPVITMMLQTAVEIPIAKTNTDNIASTIEKPLHFTLVHILPFSFSI